MHNYHDTYIPAVTYVSMCTTPTHHAYTHKHTHTLFFLREREVIIVLIFLELHSPGKKGC